jgi:hypothetical protein
MCTCPEDIMYSEELCNDCRNEINELFLQMEQSETNPDYLANLSKTT